MLTNTQVKAFEQQLKQRFLAVKEDIRQALLQSDDQSYIKLSGSVHDMGEAAVADLLVDLNLAGIDRLVEEIREIDTALMRMSTGHYGRCAHCGKDIDVARMEVNPTAKRCSACQVAHERQAWTHNVSL